jgi:16S rRNA (uracil1498-N3)-methyltransferase
MPPRLHAPGVVLSAGHTIELPPDAARHVQVLRLQPGDALTLFDGQGGEWSAQVRTMGKREVRAEVQAHHAVERELPIAVTLALAMPAGDRMDFVVEKATELGAAAIVPLIAERSVLRLAGERAEKRRAHWQAIAVAACEQCGRNRVPQVAAPLPLPTWLAALSAPAAGHARWLLGWREAQSWAAARASCASSHGALLLSGPEGGFSDAEEALARARGFAAVTLGPRVLRADTAPLAALAAIALHHP